MLHAFEPQSHDTLEKQGNACRAPEQADAEFGVRGPHTDMWGLCCLRTASSHWTAALPRPHSSAAGISHVQQEGP